MRPRRDVHDQNGWNLKEAGRYGAAIDEFEIAIRNNRGSDNAVAGKSLVGKGECLLELGENRKARKSFEEALNLSNNHDWTYTHAWSYTGVGRSYHNEKQYDHAIEYYDKSIHLITGGVDAWFWKGKALNELKRYEEAETVLTMALQNAYRLMRAKQHFIPEIEKELQKAKAGKAKPNQATQVIIHGNNTAPVNIGGIQATGNAVINRATIENVATKERPHFCSNCGKPLDDDAIFCSFCGRKIE